MIARLRPVPVLVAFALLTAVVVLLEGRGTTFHYDEWDFLLGRRGTDVETLLRAHNGNMSVFPVALFKGLVALFGLEAYWVWRVVLVALHLGVAALLFVLLRRRVGAWPAAAGTALLLVLGRTGDNMLWPAQFGFLLAIGGGLLALLALDAPARDLRRNLLACGALVLALGSSSVGIPFAIAAGIRVLAARELRPRLWVLAVPALMYLAWTAGYGESQFRAENVAKTPDFAAQMAATAVGATFGLDSNWGKVIAVALLAGLVAWWRRGGLGTPLLLGVLVALAASFVLTGFARASIEQPEAPRYVYGAAILGLLAAAEVLRGRDWDRRAVAPVLVLMVWCTFSGWGAFHARADQQQGFAEDVEARLGALDLLPGEVPFDFRPVPQQPQVVAGKVVALQRDEGERLGLSAAELAEATPGQRAGADDVLLDLGLLSVAPTASSCTRGRSGEAVALPPGGQIVLTGTGEVRAARFADPGAALPVTSLGGEPVALRAAPDRAEGRPWTVLLPDGVRGCVR